MFRARIARGFALPSNPAADRSTIIEERAPWDGEDGPWTRGPMAPLRLDGSNMWHLYWRDSRDRWHEIESSPDRDIRGALEQLDRDEAGAFWG